MCVFSHISLMGRLKGSYVFEYIVNGWRSAVGGKLIMPTCLADLIRREITPNKKPHFFSYRRKKFPLLQSADVGIKMLKYHFDLTFSLLNRFLSPV